MSILNMAKRPTVVFDPKNIEHRKIATDFFRNGNWSESPVQFYIPSDSGDVISHMTAQLASYYLMKEFESGRRRK